MSSFNILIWRVFFKNSEKKYGVVCEDFKNLDFLSKNVFFAILTWILDFSTICWCFFSFSRLKWRSWCKEVMHMILGVHYRKEKRWILNVHSMKQQSMNALNRVWSRSPHLLGSWIRSECIKWLSLLIGEMSNDQEKSAHKKKWVGEGVYLKKRQNPEHFRDCQSVTYNKQEHWIFLIKSHHC